MVHLTPLQRLLSVNYRDSAHRLLCMPKIFQLYISVYFTRTFAVFEAHADMKRQQIRRKSLSLLLKSVKITAVNELNEWTEINNGSILRDYCTFHCATENVNMKLASAQRNN